MLFASFCNINTPGQLKSHQVRQANHVKSHKCDFGAEPSSRLLATLAVKGLNKFDFELCRSPGVSHKFVINEADRLQKRPKFNSVVSRGTALGGFKPQL
jgi:hypothetical protein